MIKNYSKKKKQQRDDKMQSIIFNKTLNKRFQDRCQNQFDKYEDFQIRSFTKYDTVETKKDEYGIVSTTLYADNGPIILSKYAKTTNGLEGYIPMTDKKGKKFVKYVNLICWIGKAVDSYGDVIEGVNKYTIKGFVKDDDNVFEGINVSYNGNLNEIVKNNEIFAIYKTGVDFVNTAVQDQDDVENFVR